MEHTSKCVGIHADVNKPDGTDILRCGSCGFWVGDHTERAVCKCLDSTYCGRIRIADAVRCEHHPIMRSKATK